MKPLITTGSNTANPAGSPTTRNVRAAPTVPPQRPSADVAAKQDPAYSATDFERDLDRATRRIKPPAAKRAERDPGSSRTLDAD